MCSSDLAERVHAGNSLPQAAINRLLAEQAAMGKRVLRLHAGDALTGGRGEGEYLRQRGIATIMAPGIAAWPQSESAKVRA